jgi:hypothetical protein
MSKIRELLKQREIEVFITDIKNNDPVDQLENSLAGLFPELKINFDLSDGSMPYPCGHTVLRIEGTDISAEKIKSTITHMGFNCEVLEDKICKG